MEMHATQGMGYEIVQFMRNEDGVSFIEGALVASLIAVVAAIALLAWSKGKNGWL
jgi:Flp pilus assembly pilin Flp